MQYRFRLCAKIHQSLIERVLLQCGQTGGQTSGQIMSPRMQEILEQIKMNPSVIHEELSDTLHISPSAIQKHIEKLKKGYIRRAGGNFGGHWEIIAY